MQPRTNSRKSQRAKPGSENEEFTPPPFNKNKRNVSKEKQAYAQAMENTTRRILISITVAEKTYGAIGDKVTAMFKDQCTDAQTRMTEAMRSGTRNSARLPKFNRSALVEKIILAGLEAMAANDV